MKKFFLLALVAVLFSATSCSTYLRSIHEPNAIVKLTPADYTLSEPVSAEVEFSTILGIDWAHLFNQKTANTSNILGAFLTSYGESMAIYELLEKNPGWDFVMYPQVQSESHGIPFLFETQKLTVTARLGKFNK